MDPKKYPLIIGLLIPTLMVVVIGASVLVPRLFAPPAKFDFIYSVSDGYYPECDYFVKEHKIQLRDLKDPSRTQTQPPYTPVSLYRHYVKDNRSERLSFDEAGKLSLADSPQSPDGFEVGYGTHGSSFLFFYSSYSDYGTMYLKGHGVAYKLNLAQGRNYYSYNNFRFMGWVLP